MHQLASNMHTTGHLTLSHISRLVQSVPLTWTLPSTVPLITASAIIPTLVTQSKLSITSPLITTKRPMTTQLPPLLETYNDLPPFPMHAGVANLATPCPMVPPSNYSNSAVSQDMSSAAQGGQSAGNPSVKTGHHSAHARPKSSPLMNA